MAWTSVACAVAVSVEVDVSAAETARVIDADAVSDDDAVRFADAEPVTVPMNPSAVSVEDAVSEAVPLRVAPLAIAALCRASIREPDSADIVIDTSSIRPPHKMPEVLERAT